MSRVNARLLYWSPRVLSIVLVLFLGMFALDVFGESRGFWQTIAAFLIHLIPAMLIAGVLIAAWRWEWIGAALYSVAAVYYAVTVLPGHMDWAATISVPLLAIAALFLMNWMERSELRSLR